MDPTPFLHKDLDPEAEEFIESWALEFPSKSRIHIVIHLEQLPAEGDTGVLVSEAIHNYYDYKVGLALRGLRRLLREGRKSLVIGLSFLALCLVAANAIERLATGTFLTIMRESLTIGGWVAMWRPMQIFLYDWWPVTRRIRFYRSLSRAQVHIVHGK